jgi:hypothetical protein
MKTSSFRLYAGAGRISIARDARRVVPGFRVYRPLAPGPWFNSVGYDEYSRLYAEILARLDPQQTFDELVALTAPHEPILMCWEAQRQAPDGAQRCHRLQVARWLEAALGVEVPEL